MKNMSEAKIIDDCFICEKCGKIYRNPLDAAFCCDSIQELETAYECPKCKKLHEFIAYAEDCCSDV